MGGARACIMWSRVVLATLVVGAACSVSQETVNRTLANTPHDTLLTFTQLAREYGHRAETHYVVTEDGYILALFHIPGDRSRPVLLNHGVFGTADGYIIRGNRSMAIAAADAGYDVWGFNIRGNRYSRNHTTLNPDTDLQFWDFTLTDVARYDLAAVIDYILLQTGQKQVSVIGFSQGTTITFILACINPSYNSKIKSFAAMAPIVYLTNVRPLLSYLMKFSQFLNWIVPQNIVELAGYYSLTKTIINVICTQTLIGYELCYLGGYNSLSGNDPTGIERAFFPVTIGHFPAGSARKPLLHFAQIGLSKTFADYDYGPTENIKRYLSFTPPAFDLKKVTMPVFLVSGKTDSVSTLEDIANLKSKLSNVESFVVDSAEYNHLDHLWDSTSYEKEYVYILAWLKKHL